MLKEHFSDWHFRKQVPLRHFVAGLAPSWSNWQTDSMGTGMRDSRVLGQGRNDMAGGWTRDGAVQDQIDDTVKDAVLRARALTPKGETAEECDEGQNYAEGRFFRESEIT